VNFLERGKTFFDDHGVEVESHSSFERDSNHEHAILNESSMTAGGSGTDLSKTVRYMNDNLKEANKEMLKNKSEEF